jgi:hypothetical protein
MYEVVDEVNYGVIGQTLTGQARVIGRCLPAVGNAVLSRLPAYEDHRQRQPISDKRCKRCAAFVCRCDRVSCDDGTCKRFDRTANVLWSTEDALEIGPTSPGSPVSVDDIVVDVTATDEFRDLRVVTYAGGQTG